MGGTSTPKHDLNLLPLRTMVIVLVIVIVIVTQRITLRTDYTKRMQTNINPQRHLLRHHQPTQGDIGRLHFLLPQGGGKADLGSPRDAVRRAVVGVRFRRRLLRPGPPRRQAQLVHHPGEGVHGCRVRAGGAVQGDGDPRGQQGREDGRGGNGRAEGGVNDALRGVFLSPRIRIRRSR